MTELYDVISILERLWEVESLTAHIGAWDVSIHNYDGKSYIFKLKEATDD